MSLKLMYITNRADVAIVAQNCGVDRIFVDMEYIGKDTRQGGMDTVKSFHTVEDVKALRKVLSKSELLVRINPIHQATENYCSSEDEINAVIEAGADVIMLPMAKTVQELKTFTDLVNGRAKTLFLLETAEAVENIDEILKHGNVDEIHIGLNDLHLSYKKDFMFQLLVDGTVENLCNKIKACNIPYGFGGIARLGYGMLPAEHVIAEHYRLGSSAAILSRSFCDVYKTNDISKVENIFTQEIEKIRQYEKELTTKSSDFYNKNQTETKRLVDLIVDKIKNDKSQKEVFMKPIPLATPTMHGEELQFVQEAFERNWIAPLGFNCDGLEKEMSAYLSQNNGKKQEALSLVSCTSALHLAIKLAGVKPGDIVLCSDMTFAATVNPISYEGGTQVYIDSEKDTWNMDPDALEKAFEKYPEAKVVVLAHLYGTPSKMDEILTICKKHNAILIEDAAEALSATYHGTQCGTFGKYNAISFNGNKIITTSGGGMLFTETKEDREKAFFWATQAREPAPWYQHNEIGYNYRMSNVVAGIGRGQLLHLDEHRDLKEKIYFRYKEGLKDLPVKMNPYLPDTKPNFWLSCMTINEGCKIDPMTVINKLAEKNIDSRPIWKPMHMQPVFEKNDFISVHQTPVNEDIFARGLCLPSDIKMTDEEQDYVISVIKSVFEV